MKLKDLSKQSLIEVKAYHGSPYNFNKFSTEFMGAGEGGQHHGWGLYFSLQPETVYRRYGDRISTRNPDAYRFITYKGQTFEKGKQLYKIFNLIKGKGKDNALKYIESLLNDSEYLKKNQNSGNVLTKYKQIINDMSEEDIKEISLTSGQNYTVELPDIGSYLVEHRSFEKQPENVKQAIEEIRKNINLEIYKNTKGERIYYQLSLLLGSDKEASLLLHKHGIPGIYYIGGLDGKCVVIFNANDVKIIDKEYNNDSDDQDEDLELADDDISNLTPNSIKSMENMSEKMQLKIVDEKIDFFHYIQNPSEKTCIAAVKKDPSLIRFIKNPSSEVKKTAITNDVKVSFYINNFTLDEIKSLLFSNKQISADTATSVINHNINLIDEDTMFDIVKNKSYAEEILRYILDEHTNYEKFINLEFISKVFNDEGITNIICNNKILSAVLTRFFFEHKKDILRNMDKNILDKIILKLLFNKCLPISYKLENKFILKYVSKKTLQTIAINRPILTKGIELDENTQIKIVKKNPYNIQYITNPTEKVKELAVQLNPEIEEYLKY